MDFSIIVIGDEILLGQVTDTNSGFISRTLAPEGWQLRRIITTGDDPQQILQAINLCMADCPLVITTGGLGPTKDDLTKAVLIQRFGGKLIRDPEVTENIERVFDRRGLKMNPLTADQALVPDTCRVIQNRYGTAPLMWFEEGDHVLLSMPGVPFETEGMIRGEAGEAIRRHFHSATFHAHHTMVATGITESGLAMHLEDFESSIEGLGHLAYLPTPGYIRLRLDVTAGSQSEADSRVADLAARLRYCLGTYLLYDGDATPAEILIDMLRRKSQSLGTAESCTGGNIAHRITSIPGASDVFVGSVVCYDNLVKRYPLGVSFEMLDEYGAVSEPVVRAMAEGAGDCLHATCTIATSGIAGPGGGSKEKPVGTVWIAVHTPDGTESKLLHLPGDRSRVIDRATTEGILLLIDKIKDFA